LHAKPLLLSLQVHLSTLYDIKVAELTGRLGKTFVPEIKILVSEQKPGEDL
jgi:hypothetical protein